MRIKQISITSDWNVEDSERGSDVEEQIEKNTKYWTDVNDVVFSRSYRVLFLFLSAHQRLNMDVIWCFIAVVVITFSYAFFKINRMDEVII